MRHCFWYRRKKNRKDVAANDLKLKRDNDNDGMMDDIWFESKLVFESDSDDDFKSVNGDSLPSSFGYSYTSQGSPRPSFISLKERMEELAQEKVACEASVPQQHESVQNVPEEKRTLGQLFTAKPEQDKVSESEKKHSEIPRQDVPEQEKLLGESKKKHSDIPRQGSKKGHANGDASQRSCFSGFLSSSGSERKSSSSPVAQKTNTAQSCLPYRLCAS